MLFRSLLGAFLQLMLIPYGREALGITKETSGLLFLIVSFGIAVGSLLAGKISGDLIELGLVPVGALGITAGLVILSQIDAITVVCIMLVFAGVCCGLYNLPLTAFMQWRAEDVHRGKILAAVNFLNFTGILLASGCVYLCHFFRVSATEAFGLAAAAMLFLTVAAMVKLPLYPQRLVLIVVTRLFFRIRVLHGERLPAKSGALVVMCNIRGLADMFAVMVAQQRPMCIVIPASFSERWYHRLLGFFDLIVAHEGMRGKTADHIRERLETGHMVGVVRAAPGEKDNAEGCPNEALRCLLPDASTPLVPVTVSRHDGDGCGKAEGVLRGKVAVTVNVGKAL